MKNIFPLENGEIPYSEIAEKLVLSAILLDNRVIYLVSQKLNIEAFYLKKTKIFTKYVWIYITKVRLSMLLL